MEKINLKHLNKLKKVELLKGLASGKINVINGYIIDDNGMIVIEDKVNGRYYNPELTEEVDIDFIKNNIKGCLIILPMKKGEKPKA